MRLVAVAGDAILHFHQPTHKMDYRYAAHQLRHVVGQATGLKIGWVDEEVAASVDAIGQRGTEAQSQGHPSLETWILGQFLQFFFVAQITGAQHQDQDIRLFPFKQLGDCAYEAIHPLLGGEPGNHGDQWPARHIFKASVNVHVRVPASVDLGDQCAAALCLACQISGSRVVEGGDAHLGRFGRIILGGVNPVGDSGQPDAALAEGGAHATRTLVLCGHFHYFACVVFADGIDEAGVGPADDEWIHTAMVEGLLDGILGELGDCLSEAHVEHFLIIAWPGIVDGDANTSPSEVIFIARDGAQHCGDQGGVSILAVDHVGVRAQMLDQLQSRFLQGNVHLKEIIIAKTSQLGIPSAACFSRRVGINTLLLGVTWSIYKVDGGADHFGLMNTSTDCPHFELVVHGEGKFDARIYQTVAIRIHKRV